MTSPDRERVRAYYASFGQREWERLMRPADGAVEFAVTLAALERHLIPGSRVFDIGGGPGRYALALAERGHRVVLADLSPELLAIARERVADSPAAALVEEVVEADATDLRRWAGAAFDAAMSLGPFYHLVARADREAAVSELARVVRPGGLVFVAAMPRVAFLRRTITLPDERRHLLDDEWLRRLLDDGVFENDVPGRFSLGYGVAGGELEAVLTAHDFEVLERLSAESFSTGIETAVGEILAEGGPMASRLLDLLVDRAGDRQAISMATHLLFVARRA